MIATSGLIIATACEVDLNAQSRVPVHAHKPCRFSLSTSLARPEHLPAHLRGGQPHPALTMMETPWDLIEENISGGVPVDFDPTDLPKNASPGAVAFFAGDSSGPMELNGGELATEPTMSEGEMKQILKKYIRSQMDSEDTAATAETAFLFYGSLMDPEVLQAVLDLPEQLIFEDGWIEGYKMRMWGIYPTIVPEEGSKVYGKMWKTKTREHVERLTQYETAAYRSETCDIKLFDREQSTQGCVFIWSNAGDQKELHDGVFDLDWYQTYLKPGLLRSWRAKLKTEEEVEA